MNRMRQVARFFVGGLWAAGRVLLRIARRISGPGAGPKLVVG